MGIFMHPDYDFTIETKIFEGDKWKKSGGLLIWKEETSFMRFEMPSSSNWEGEVRFEGHIKDKYRIIGRGLLDADQLILRLIRKGDHFSAYCSKDGVEWFTCGYVDFLMNDPIKIGIIAHCPKAVAPSTSTRFEYFKIYCE
jgi:regulation of enolase protein 1 (concanavalin A-like superfamily)